MESATASCSSALEAIGSYASDRVYESSGQIVDRLLEALDLGSAASVLDAMASDGALLRQVAGYCRRRGFTLPDLMALAPGRVQAEFTRAALSDLPVTILQRDLWSTADAAPLPAVDRIVLKSASHQIPRERQENFFEAVFQALKPGGTFVNLGFLFDDPRERDEFTEITRWKEELGRPPGETIRRHFLTRDELYGFLTQAGFIDVSRRQQLDYAIHSSAIEKAYGTAGAELQAAQARALALRRAGRIRFERDHSLMMLPSELTVCRRPTLQEETRRAFRDYPMDFLRHVEAHRRLLAEALRWIRAGDRVLDLGCGIGLLAEALLAREVGYKGVDLSAEFIRICRERYGGAASFRFECADLNHLALDGEAVDVVILLNTLNMPGLDAVRVLRQAWRALKPEGRLVVSGPTSQESLSRAEPHLLAQLERDGLSRTHRAQIEALREANRRLLTEHANYWSVEGMVELLSNLGFRSAEAVDTQQYYGFAYMVVAKK